MCETRPPPDKFTKWELIVERGLDGELEGDLLKRTMAGAEGCLILLDSEFLKSRQMIDTDYIKKDGQT